MLVLSRRENERIRVGESIVVTIIRLGREKVRLGIEAPSDVRVLRDELDPFETTTAIVELDDEPAEKSSVAATS